ncbi:hypothetical protein [Paractinoplanes toevensis]|uniref:hypothetical protein n=1 Tax=Paractinoplanes toevensis TaxID=571911 RepID=UPI001BB30F85|nr:hypothetical protein [Actinoplanes toevensis]
MGAFVPGLFLGSGLFLASPDAAVRRGHDLAGDVYTADRRYELRVFHWDFGPGQDEWQVLVERRGPLRFVAVDAGCVSATVTSYRSVDAFEPGHARLTTDTGVIDIRFDAQTMHVTDPIPGELCPGD